MDRIIKGVYQIKCKATGQVYIGSSSNVEKRYRQHIEALSNKTHTNYKLQTLFIRNGGIGNFELSVLEEAPKNFLRGQVYDLEQKWLDATPNLLNILTDAKAHLVKQLKQVVAKPLPLKQIKQKKIKKPKAKKVSKPKNPPTGLSLKKIEAKAKKKSSRNRLCVSNAGVYERKLEREARQLANKPTSYR